MEEVLNEQARPTEESSQAAAEPLDMAATITQLVRRHPLGAVALAFGASVLVGWLIAHDLKARFYSRGRRARRKLADENRYTRDISDWEDEGGAIPSTDEGGEN